MPPRINLFAASRSLAYRPKPRLASWRIEPAFQFQPALCRAYSSSKDLPATPAEAKGAEEETLESVSEEAAKIGKITGCGGPEIEQGTPVSEIVKGDKAAQDLLPKVMRDSLNATTPKGSRSFSTSARQGMSMEVVASSPAEQLPMEPGLKFPAPTLPLPPHSHYKFRYDSLVNQLTNMMMRHGEKAVAQRQMAALLAHLRTSPAPKFNPTRPLLPETPPSFHLPHNPVLYLTVAIDSVAPLTRIRNQRGAAGGGGALQIPRPLGKRQRRRTAIQWILAAAAKRRNKGSGKDMFALRIAEEIIAVVEGRSAVWERRNGAHKMAVSARANLNWSPDRGRRK